MPKEAEQGLRFDDEPREKVSRENSFLNVTESMRRTEVLDLDAIHAMYAEKLRAIESLDIERAAELKIKIDRAYENRGESEACQAIADALESLRIAVEARRSALADLSETDRQESSHHANRFEAEFENQRSIHMQTLVDLERDHAMRTYCDADAAVPEQAELLAKAKVAAHDDDFTTAIRLRGESRDTARDSLGGRLTVADDEFRAAVDAQMIKHQAALDALESQHDDELFKLRTEIETRHRAIERAFDEQVRKLREYGEIIIDSLTLNAVAKRSAIAALRKRVEEGVVEARNDEPPRAILSINERMRVPTLSPTRVLRNRPTAEIDVKTVRARAQMKTAVLPRKPRAQRPSVFLLSRLIPLTETLGRRRPQ